MKAPNPRAIIAVTLTCAAATIASWSMFADSMRPVSCGCTYALPDTASAPSPICAAIAEPAAPETVAETYAALPAELAPETFTVTAYCPCEVCCGEYADGYTCTGAKATQGRTVAVDPFVIPLGSTVIIDGHEYIAEDIGGAIDGNRIEIFFDNHADALAWGVKCDIEIEIKY